MTPTVSRELQGKIFKIHCYSHIKYRFEFLEPSPKIQYLARLSPNLNKQHLGSLNVEPVSGSNSKSQILQEENINVRRDF